MWKSDNCSGGVAIPLSKTRFSQKIRVRLTFIQLLNILSVVFSLGFNEGGDLAGVGTMNLLKTELAENCLVDKIPSVFR